MSEVIIAMRRLGKTIMFATCLVTVTGCTQSQHQVRETGQAKWAQSMRRADRNIPEYTPPKILPQTHYAAARLLEKQGLVDDAIVQYRKAIVLNHSLVAAHHRLGILLSAAGRHEEAINSLRKAVELSPKHAVLHNDLGAELMFSERWAGAEFEFRKATALRPDFARAHVNRGIALTRLDRFDDAKRCFKAILPAPDALYNLGLMYRGQKRFIEAAQTFREVLELDPNFMAARMQLDQVAHLLPSQATNEFVGPRHENAQRMSVDVSNHTRASVDTTRAQTASIATNTSDTSAPFDVVKAQQRREIELKNRQAHSSRRPAHMAREHVSNHRHQARMDNNSDDDYVHQHSDQTVQAEKLAPMLKFFRPVSEAQLQQQQAQSESSERSMTQSSSSQAWRVQDKVASWPGTSVAVFPFDSPCETEEYWPGEGEDFDALVESEIRGSDDGDMGWSIESFLPITLASKITPQLWCEADDWFESLDSPINYSIAEDVGQYEIESLVAVEEPCQDTIDEDDSTLQKFAAVQRIHQQVAYDMNSASSDNFGRRDFEPVSRNKLSFGAKNASTDDMAHDWQDCFAAPAIASAVVYPQDSDVTYSTDVRMTLLANHRKLLTIRNEIHCLEHTLVERELVQALAEEKAFLENVMFGAGWQIPRRTSDNPSRLSSYVDASYVPTPPGISQQEGMLSSVSRNSPSRRSTMSSVVMPRYRTSTFVGNDYAFTDTLEFQQADEQYVQDYDLQMSVAVEGYNDRPVDFSNDPTVFWSLDPAIMDAPLEVLINETNCWKQFEPHSQSHDMSAGIRASSYSVEKASSLDGNLPEYADVRRRERVRKENDNDNDDVKNNRHPRRDNRRRSWFKP